MELEQEGLYALKELPKVYSLQAIRLGTFIGGPLVAGYFISENYKVFCEPEKIMRTWLYTIAFTVVVFSIAFLTPENVKIPNVVFPIIYSWIIYYVAKRLQENNLTQNASSGGKVFGWWRVIGISLISTIITLTILMILILIVGLFVY